MDQDQGQTVPHLDREINGRCYRAHQLKITRWAELTEHLAKMLGEPFGQALRGGSVNMDALLDGDTAVALLALLVERLTARNLLHLLEIACGSQRAKAAGSLRLMGESGGYNTRQLDQWHKHFQLHMADLAPAILLFLEAQYVDFFDGLKGVVPAPKKDHDARQSTEDQDSIESRGT